MPQFINTNIASLNTQRALNQSQSSLQTSLQRLSSGLRINSAKDDAAGLAISERFTAQIRGLNQAVRNANDGISLAQTAEGALAEITNNLQRVRELAVQSANATNSSSDRAALQTEVTALIDEIDRVATQSEFNGVSLLDGTFSTQTFQVGANANQTINIASIGSARTATLGQQFTASSAGTGLDGATTTDLSALTINSVAVGTGTITTDAQAIVNAINAASISGVTASVTANTSVAAGTQVAADLGAGTLTINGVTTGSIDTTGVAASDRTLGVNAINAISAATGVTATDTGSGISLAASDGRNITVAFNTVTAASLGMAVAATTEASYSVNYAGSTGESLVIAGVGNSGLTAATTNVALSGTSVANTSVATDTSSQIAIASIDAALTTINSSRASLGAIQNRFQSTVSNLSTSAENLSAARSRIQDADFAAETAQLTRNQILQQAGIAMLSQANAAPQNVLALLQ